MRAVGVLLLLGASAVARAQLECAPGVAFYRGGALRSCELTAIHRFQMPSGQVLVCAAARRAELDREGRVRGCTLAIDYTDGGRRCAGGSAVVLGRDGAVRRCAPPR